jgi:hypothetical protein
VRISSDHDQPCGCRQLKKLPIFRPAAAFLGSRTEARPLLIVGNFCLSTGHFLGKPGKICLFIRHFFPIDAIRMVGGWQAIGLSTCSHSQNREETTHPFAGFLITPTAATEPDFAGLSDRPPFFTKIFSGFYSNELFYKSRCYAHVSQYPCPFEENFA